jgi:hypothetical protein
MSSTTKSIKLQARDMALILCCGIYGDTIQNGARSKKNGYFNIRQDQAAVLPTSRDAYPTHAYLMGQVYHVGIL